jgi:hypothetical protein
LTSGIFVFGRRPSRRCGWQTFACILRSSLKNQFGNDAESNMLEACAPVPFMIIDMRTYKIKPGKRSEFLNIFDAKSVPAHQKIGMEILGLFLSVEDDDTFIWMRAFPDQRSASRMQNGRNT